MSGRPAIVVASCLALFTGSAMLAAPGQDRRVVPTQGVERPGQSTKGQVWIENRGRAEAIPIAAPSANRSMLLSPTTGSHVEKSLGETIDLILDAGATPVGIESTVIDLSTAEPTLLRPGTISLTLILPARGTFGSVNAGIVSLATAACSTPAPKKPRHQF